MKKVTSILIIGIAFLFTNCKDSNIENSLFVFDLKDLNKSSKVLLSDLGATDIQYIPLTTDSLSMVGKIKTFRADNNAYFFMDYNAQLKSFSHDGNYNGMIGIHGRGPKEYRYPNDFTPINEGNVAILSNQEKLIYIYNKNGVFLKTINAPDQITDIFGIEDYIICFRANRNGTVINSIDLIDLDGNVVKTFPNKFKIKQKKSYSSFSSECLFYNKNGHTYLKEVCSDTVFEFQDKNLIPSIVFNGENNSLPASAREDGIFGLEVLQKYIIQRNLIRFSDHIYFEFSYEGTLYGLWGSLKRNSQLLINLNEGIINDIDGGMNFWFNQSFGEDTIVCYVNAFELKAHVASEAFKNATPKYPEKKKELEQLANSLDENDNPVLMLVKLKK